MSTKCFYHSADFDGKCSAAIVKLRKPDAELYPIDYGQTFPFESITEYDEVWMVDFSLPMDQMIKLRSLCNYQLVWIDHHKTAIEAAAEMDFEPLGLRMIGKAGCELTWAYYNGILGCQDAMPLAVYLLGRYDEWDHSAHSEILPFQYGMRVHAHEPTDVDWWNNLFDRSSAVYAICETGCIVKAYQEAGYKAVCEMAAFDLQWEGLTWTCINGPYKGSGVHASRFDMSKYDAMMGFYWNGNLWRFSLSTQKPDVDVSIIAKRHGGGGHKGAAGFEMKFLPFKLEGERIYVD